MKVYHAPYANNEDLDTMYDHSNNAVSGSLVPIAGAANNQKVLSYYTQLNGQRIRNITIGCTATGPFLDYMSHRRQICESVLSNLYVF